jgi:ketosteroid isomerase-like protein
MAKAEAANTDIADFLKNFARAYEYQDPAGILKLYSSAPNILLLGTHKKDRFTGSAEILKAYTTEFKKSEPTLFEFHILSQGATEETAWVAAECSVRTRKGLKKIKQKGFITLVLERDKKSHDLRIVHQHLSIPGGQ